MTRAITPKYSDSLIKIDVIVNFTVDGVNKCCALFKDSAADAIAVSHNQDSSDNCSNISLSFIETSGSTSERTYKVRVGGDGADVTFNGDNNDTARYGGVLTSSIIITEIKQ